MIDEQYTRKHCVNGVNSVNGATRYLYKCIFPFQLTPAIKLFSHFDIYKWIDRFIIYVQYMVMHCTVSLNVCGSKIVNVINRSNQVISEIWSLWIWNRHEICSVNWNYLCVFSSVFLCFTFFIIFQFSLLITIHNCF